jgi:GGDEF domain-containing protein
MAEAGVAAMPAGGVFQALIEAWPGPVALVPPEAAAPAWRNAAFRRMEGVAPVAPGVPALLQGPQADPEAMRAIDTAREENRRVATRVLLSPEGDVHLWAELQVLPLQAAGQPWLALLLNPLGQPSPGAGEGQAAVMADGQTLLARAGELLVLRRRGSQPGPDLCLALIGIDRRGRSQEELAFGVGEQLRQGLRRGDMLGRLPDGDFLLVLPGLRRGQALAVAERLLDNLEATEFETKTGLRNTTCSAGLAFADDEDGAVETVLLRARAALQRAQASGGGQAAAA